MGLEDPRQYLCDSEEAQRLSLDGRQSGIWTAMPCIVQSINYEQMTLTAIPAIQGRMENSDGNLSFTDMPVIVDVPLVFPSCSGFSMTFPLIEGDEVLVVFASRCIDSWWQNGGYSNKPMEYRMHDLSDGFAIPGPRSLQNVLSSINTTDLQIRDTTGTTFLSIGADGKVGLQNSITSLKTALTDLTTALNVFMTALAALSGGASPTPQSALQVPAAAAVTAIGTASTLIGALLK